MNREVEWNSARVEPHAGVSNLGPGDSGKTAGEQEVTPDDGSGMPGGQTSRSDGKNRGDFQVRLDLQASELRAIEGEPRDDFQDLADDDEVELVGLDEEEELQGETANAGSPTQSVVREWLQGVEDPDGNLDMDCMMRVDRLTRTIIEVTGWELSWRLCGNGSMLCPVFSDGDKSYVFLMWKILVTFSNAPGMVLLDWSPETLEHDIKVAKDTTAVRVWDPQYLVDALLDNVPEDRLREIRTLLGKRLGL